MTVAEALAIAQHEHPLDLVARLDYMRTQAMVAPTTYVQMVWQDAIEITRNGEQSVRV